MAIYHCSIKNISRSGGRSVVAASAYRAGEKLEDQETGLIHNYTNNQRLHIRKYFSARMHRRNIIIEKFCGMQLRKLRSKAMHDWRENGKWHCLTS